jgi:uncharacterized membrane protein YcaP (DUF421 family)
METVVRGAAIYVILLLVIRLSGRRTLSQMTTFDFVLVLIIAETTQQALLGDDFSITNAVVLFVTLIVLDIGFSYVKRWWSLADKFIEGRPTLLVVNGEPDEAVMRKARVGLSDVLQAGRSQHGVERLDQVKFAVLEVGGEISVIPKAR